MKKLLVLSALLLCAGCEHRTEIRENAVEVAKLAPAAQVAVFLEEPLKWAALGIFLAAGYMHAAKNNFPVQPDNKNQIR